jgi:imidazolonepropionase-like amidohydrolase
MKKLSVAAAIMSFGLAMLSACSKFSPDIQIIDQTPYAADSGNLLVECGTLIDGLSDTPRADMNILIEDGRITDVGNVLVVSPTIPRLDLSDSTCLPGFIDMHTHIMDTVDDTDDLSKYFAHTREHTLANGAKHGKKTLDAGFTTVRNLGTYYGWTSREHRDLINRGDAIGPRMQIAGFYLSIPGGGGDLLVPGVAESDVPLHLRLGVARGAGQFREKAQAAVDGGADVLKIIASGAVLAYGGVPGSPEMTPEEIAAVVEVAHAAGLRVTAHCHGAQSVKDAIRAGVDSIEHASLIDDEGIRLAAENDVALSMDIYDGDWIAVEGRKQGWPDEFIRKNDETTMAQRENFRKAHEAGVTIVYGTDSGVYPHGVNGRQFAYMVEWGMTPMEAIKAATSVAARYMDWEDRVGAITPGRYGDIVAVKGDPLIDISVLENVDTVIKGGLVFKKTL